MFANNCKDCGSITLFADDTIYVNSDRLRDRNQIYLENMMMRLKDYLANSRMAMNYSKTIIWEFMLKQNLCKIKGTTPSLMTTTDRGEVKEIKPLESNTCLGGILQKDLQWKAQLETGENAILPILRKKLGVLKYVARNVQNNILKLYLPLQILITSN